MTANPNFEAIAGQDGPGAKPPKQSRRLSRQSFKLAQWAFPGATIRLSRSGDVSIFRVKDRHTTFEIFRPHFSANACANVFAVLRHRKLGAQYTNQLLQIVGHKIEPPAGQPQRWSAGTITVAAAWALAAATPPQMLKALLAVAEANPLPEQKNQ